MSQMQHLKYVQYKRINIDSRTSIYWAIWEGKGPVNRSTRLIGYNQFAHKARFWEKESRPAILRDPVNRGTVYRGFTVYRVILDIFQYFGLKFSG